MLSNAPRILVTGASGFLGAACIARLSEEGLDVHAVSSKSRSSPACGVHWHRYDLLDPAQCELAIAGVKPTHLLHLAWIATPGQFWESDLNLKWLASSVSLAQAFYARGGERAVGVGTCAEYSWVITDYSEETTPLIPETVYGRCKHAFRIALEEAATVHGRSCAWARIFFPYGPGEPPQRLIPSVIRGLLRAEPVECTAGTQVRDFVFVDDVAAALVALLKADASGSFNVGSGRPATLRDVVSVIVDQLGRADLVKFGARTAPAGDPPWVVANVAKLKRETGWEPRVSMEAGIARTIGYWRDQIRA
jgi:nucleoside-diphosphate-sugar epimerase